MLPSSGLAPALLAVSPWRKGSPRPTKHRATSSSSPSGAAIADTPTGTGFIAISANRVHSIALYADGSIVAWGFNLWGQVSGTPSGGGFIAISAGRTHNLALHADGSIAAWGNDGSSQITDTPTGSNFIAITTGELQSLALTTDGSIEAWGGDSADRKFKLRFPWVR